MIIPVRCFTCGKLLANKYKHYESELLRRKIAIQSPNVSSSTDLLVLQLNADSVKKTIAGEIMDNLGLIRICCRTAMLTSVNMIEDI